MELKLITIFKDVIHVSIFASRKVVCLFNTLEMNEVFSLQWEQTKYIYSVCYTKGGSHHHLHLAETQRQLVKWEIFIVKERDLFRYALIGGHSHGKVGILCISQDCIRSILSISDWFWVGSKKKKTNKYVNCWSSPDYSGPIAAKVWLLALVVPEVVVWVPGLLILIRVLLAIYGLAIARVYSVFQHGN